MRAPARHRHISNRRRTSAPLLGLAALATVVPLVAAPSAGAVSIPLPDGNNVRTLSPVRGGYINRTLQGAECQAPKICTPIDYPSFVSFVGIDRLDTVLKDPALPADTVVFAYSNGAQIATRWIAMHADDPDAPSPDNVKFLLLGNSLRKYGGSDNELNISQPSQYQIVDVSRQYDPVSDFPDNGFNFLAVANALAGSQSMHDYRGVDVDDPNNVVWTEGNITYVLVPTEDLPLLAPLRALGLTALADRLNAQLKPMVDAGYDRSYIPDGTPNKELVDGTADAPATTAVAAKTATKAPKALTSTSAVTAIEPTTVAATADSTSTEPEAAATTKHATFADEVNAAVERTTKKLSSFKLPSLAKKEAAAKAAADAGSDAKDSTSDAKPTRGTKKAEKASAGADSSSGGASSSGGSAD